MDRVIPNTVNDVFADIRHKHRAHVGVYPLTRNAEGYFERVFRGSIDQAIGDGYDYNDARETIHALLKLAAEASATRAFTKHPLDRRLTTMDVWHGLVAAKWIGCAVDEEADGTLRMTGRWCNLIEPCPPDEPDCEVPFDFMAGKSHDPELGADAESPVSVAATLGGTMRDPRLLADLAKVKPIVRDEIWVTLERVVGRHSPAQGAKWFLFKFEDSINYALDNNTDWNAARNNVLSLVTAAGLMMAVRADIRGGPDEPLTEEDVKLATRAVRDTACGDLSGATGKWCNFIGDD